MAQLDIDAAVTPSQLTHTIFGGIGYIFKEWKNPLMLGLGGWYEFASDRSDVESFLVWAKIGVHF